MCLAWASRNIGGLRWELSFLLKRGSESSLVGELSSRKEIVETKKRSKPPSFLKRWGKEKIIN
jgi:hypothetical protein